MAHINQKVLTLLPEGSEVLDLIYNKIVGSLTVKYSYNDKIQYRQLTRISLYAANVAKDAERMLHFEGMTVNDVFEIYSKRSGIDLVKGEDYDDDDTLVQFGLNDISTSPYSLRFKPTLMHFYIIDPKQALISDEKTRNLIGMDSNPFKEGLEKELRKLGTILFNGTDLTCFDQNLLTLDFRNFIISKIDLKSEYGETIKNEILTSTIISFFNDGLSDVILLVGKNNIVFLLRFKSAQGDIPVLF